MSARPFDSQLFPTLLITLLWLTLSLSPSLSSLTLPSFTLYLHSIIGLCSDSVPFIFFFSLCLSLALSVVCKQPASMKQVHFLLPWQENKSCNPRGKRYGFCAIVGTNAHLCMYTHPTMMHICPEA